jgi:hypothetical protein
LNKNLFNALCRQYLKIWTPWKELVKEQKYFEQFSASIEIQRVIRGFIDRIYVKRVKIFRSVVKLQCLGRKFLAKKTVNLIKKNIAVHSIQAYFRKRVDTHKARNEVQRRYLYT